jgi:hypothetical protein
VYGTAASHGKTVLAPFSIKDLDDLQELLVVAEQKGVRDLDPSSKKNKLAGLEGLLVHFAYVVGEEFGSNRPYRYALFFPLDFKTGLVRNVIPWQCRCNYCPLNQHGRYTLDFEELKNSAYISSHW